MKRNTLKIGLCLLGAAVLMIAARPLMVTKAESGSFVTWKEGSKNQVGISLCLQKGDPLDEIVTFQVGFQLQGEEIEDVSFAFDNGLKKNSEIPVKEVIYDEESQVLMIYVSGRETVLKKTDLSLGKLSVSSENDVEISVIEDSCITVDRFHRQETISDFGETENYYMALGQTKPSEETPEETTQTETEEIPEETTSPEPSKPSRPSSDDDDDDSDYDSSSYLGIRGNWIMEGTSWIFRKEDGTRAKNEWAMINGKWYWFDELGYMKTGWILYNGQWYYCGTDGDMKTGWIYDNNTWYFAETSGIMKTGWISVNGSWYYMDSNGKMAVDTTTPDGYQVDKSGAWILN